MSDAETTAETFEVIHIFKADDALFGQQGMVSITDRAAMQICINGLCITMPITEWHALAAAHNIRRPR